MWPFCAAICSARFPFFGSAAATAPAMSAPTSSSTARISSVLLFHLMAEWIFAICAASSCAALLAATGASATGAAIGAGFALAGAESAFVAAFASAFSESTFVAAIASAFTASELSPLPAGGMGTFSLAGAAAAGITAGTCDAPTGPPGPIERDGPLTALLLEPRGPAALDGDSPAPPSTALPRLDMVPSGFPPDWFTSPPAPRMLTESIGPGPPPPTAPMPLPLGRDPAPCSAAERFGCAPPSPALGDGPVRGDSMSRPAEERAVRAGGGFFMPAGQEQRC
mmetsp:Transcript_11192/g.28881  ORF Transcript_11192/g.28881 Transcript_11192/m.28881 type:complete len:282 (-) Transcript_11192:39-884(-)